MKEADDRDCKSRMTRTSCKQYYWNNSIMPLCYYHLKMHLGLIAQPEFMQYEL